MKTHNYEKVRYLSFYKHILRISILLNQVIFFLVVKILLVALCFTFCVLEILRKLVKEKKKEGDKKLFVQTYHII